MQAWKAQLSTVPGVSHAPETFRRGGWAGPSGAHRDASPRRDGQGLPGGMEPYVRAQQGTQCGGERSSLCFALVHT